MLAANPAVRRVVAIDAAGGPDASAAAGAGSGPDRLSWCTVDVRDPSVAGALAGVDVVAHLALDASLDTPSAQRRATSVRGTQTVLTAAAAAGVRRLVLCTSAAVYGALPDNPVPLDEDGPLRAVPDDGVLGDLLEVERVAETARTVHPGLAVTVLRPATLVGAGVDSVLTRHFEAPRLLVVRGTHPHWQFCHVEDLVSALELAVLGAVDGVVTVGAEGWLEQEQVERVSGLRRIELPATLAFGTAERLHRLGVIPAPASELQYLVHPWVVPVTRLRAAGWRPVYDNETALGALLEQVNGQPALATLAARRVGRKDAGIGAGAAVAVVGTAAVVRQLRRRRRS
ncbi:MAG: NAD-dependent epimerase/dehydratase family protein [Actinomycetota bacterium]|nr:NAD-dependent epimerase/dehydratase family protein [Actinomycetota bacterium]